MSERTLLLIQALTSLHPGTGTALGVVDLPVQRERHTGWPVIPGSSLKGVLRDECRQRIAEQRYDRDLDKANEDKELEVVFGPAKVEDQTSHAGALMVTDARILAFPVRSLRGVFAWVTCPAVLQRLARDLSYVKQGSPSSAAVAAWPGVTPEVQEQQALCPVGSPLIIEGKSLVVEEFDFVAKESEAAGAIADWMAAVLPDQTAQERFSKSLVVLTDDDFNHFVAYATEVLARVGLDYERKTVKTGALFYEEFLPPETVLYSVLGAETGRQKRENGKEPMTAGQVMDFLRSNLPPFVQIGGDETIGKGVCSLALVN